MTRTRLLLPLVALLVQSACTGMSSRGAPVGAMAFDATPAQSADDRTIIRTSELALAVETLDSGRTAVLAVVQAHGGRVARETGTEHRKVLEVRVPEARLDEATDAVARLGRVIRRSATVEDQTVEAADLDARVKNLQAARDRLRTLAQRAESVTDVVAVERELSRVQGELDGLEAQLRVLRDRAAMSTLSVQLEEQVVLGPVSWVLHGATKVVTKLFIWR
jgi:Domain of unknown function (DUF4349)